MRSLLHWPSSSTLKQAVDVLLDAEGYNECPIMRQGAIRVQAPQQQRANSGAAQLMSWTGQPVRHTAMPGSSLRMDTEYSRR